MVRTFGLWSNDLDAWFADNGPPDTMMKSNNILIHGNNVLLTDFGFRYGPFDGLIEYGSELDYSYLASTLRIVEFPQLTVRLVTL